MQIKGSQNPIGKIFEDFDFRIPLYQRPYSWQREHAEELLDDLLGFVGTDGKPINELTPYFLGSIVVVKEDHKSEADIIDGQQRLTNLTILLAAMRNLLTGDAAAALTKFIYVKGNSIEGTVDRFRLRLRDRDADFFRDHVQKEGQFETLRNLDAGKLSDSQNNVRSNAIALADRLSRLGTEACERFAQFVIRQCFLVVVSTPDFDSSYRIFTVLNDRGLDLSHSDILKSEIVGKIADPLDREKYGERWEETEAILGRAAFTDLFSHTRTIFRKAKPKGTVLAEFREHVLKKVPEPIRFLDELLFPFARAYADIKGADYESASGADGVNRILKWLTRINNADWLPPTILYVARNANDPQALTQCLADLERLAATLMVTRAGVNKRIERYGRLSAAIENQDDLSGADSPLQLSPGEASETVTLLDGDVYNIAPPVRSYVLLRLDSELSGGGASYEYDLISVEHVLPQNPDAGGQWGEWFPDPVARAAVVHRLGNLALLTRKKNSSARNFEFDKKKASYFARGGVSPFALTTQVLGEPEWTPAVVARRQAALLGALKRAWKLA